VTRIPSEMQTVRRSDIGWKSGAEGAGQGRAAPTESGSLDACRCSRRIRSRERRIVATTSMEVLVAPDHDFAGVLGRVQGPLRRSEWSIYVAPWTRPPRSRLGALTGATRLWSCAERMHLASEEVRIILRKQPPACVNTRTTLTSLLVSATGVAVADHALFVLHEQPNSSRPSFHKLANSPRR
jgi:hypothetical protein